MEKKDSIFSGLNPAPPPAPAAPPRPAASEQEISELNRKIEALERRLKAPAAQQEAPKPPDSGQFVLAKISDLEKKLEEFSRSVMMSSAQMKSIEESKMGARRETEELLKVVREQQKYSEMDRQMHDQVEKAWTRVEDLEKKLLDFYASAMNRAPDERRAAQPAIQAGEVDRIVDAKMQNFLLEMDLRFKSVVSMLEGASLKSVHKSEQKAADLLGGLDVRMTAFESELKTSLKSVQREESESVKKYLNGYIVDSESRLNAISKLVADYMGRLADQSRQQGDKLERIGAAAEMYAAKSRAAAAALAEELEGMLRKHTADMAARMRDENAKISGEIVELSRLSTFSLGTTTLLAANMDELGGDLAKLRDSLKVLVDGLKNIDLGAILGVSGEVVRKNFKGLREALGGMEQHLAAFDRIKGAVNENLKERKAGEGGGKQRV